MRLSPPLRNLLPVAAALLSIVSLRAAQGDTTVPVTGIGTSITGDVDIKTYVEKVTYSGPTPVMIGGVPAFQIRGTVSGVGWGGAGAGERIVDRAANDHYRYDIPFVARWRQSCPGNRLGCFISSAIGNLCAYLEQGRTPPLSRMAGRIVGGALRFDQAGGATTNVAPVPNDPSRDAYVVAPNLTPRNIGGPETTRWLAVTAALPHVPDAITPPTVACRLGGYKLMFFGSPLVPLSPAELAAIYGSFEGYRNCVCRTVACLSAQNLYDPRVESAHQTAELARPLLGSAYAVPAITRTR